MSAKNFLQLPARRLDAALVVIAAILAGVLILLEQGRINDDGVLYLEAAKYFVRKDWQGGQEFYAWPFYSLLVALLSTGTGIGLEAAANTLSIVFFAIATYAFVRLVRLANGDNIAVVAGALLLFSNPYIVRDVLPLIWRDQGFWALYLTSLGSFILFYRHGRTADALVWQLACMIAALFRTEGLSFLVFVPLILLFKPGIGFGARCRQLLRAYSLGLVIALALLATLLCGLIEPDTSSLPAQVIGTYISQIQQLIAGGLSAKADIFGEQVLGKFLEDYAMHGLLLTMFAVIFGKILGSAGWLASLLAVFQSRIRNVQMSADAKVIFYWVGVVAIFNMLISLLGQFLLAGRYAIPFSLLVLVFAAFSLAAIYRNSSRSLAGEAAAGRRWLLPLIAFALCVHGYIIFKPKPAGYTFEKDAVEWAREYAKNDDRIFYDNPRLRYYAGLPIGPRGYTYLQLVEDGLKNGSLAQHDVLVVHCGRDGIDKDSPAIAALGYRPVKEFSTRNKATVVVFAREPAPAG